MATYPLVDETIDRDLPALVALSLAKHNVPVLDRFWIHVASTGQWQIAVVSPIVDQVGRREAYRAAFEALDRETFATKSFLGSGILLLGDSEIRGDLQRIREGASRLSSLGPFEDVDVYPVPDADAISKQGFLHFTPLGPMPAEQAVTVAFSALDRGGAVKTRNVPMAAVEPLLDGFVVAESDRRLVLESLQNHRGAHILAQTNLRKLYEMGLV